MQHPLTGPRQILYPYLHHSMQVGTINGKDEKQRKRELLINSKSRYTLKKNKQKTHVKSQYTANLRSCSKAMSLVALYLKT